MLKVPVHSRFAHILMLVALLCVGAVAQDAGKADAKVSNLQVRRDSLMRARAKAIMVEKSGGEEGFRSLCSGVKKCLNIDYGFCTEADQKPWPKVKYNDEYCEPFKEITKRGLPADPNITGATEIYSRLGRQYRVIYENRGALPANERMLSFLFDNMPFTAQLINAYLGTNYQLEYTSKNRRFFSGSNGRSLSGEFYWALQDSAGQKLGMRNVFFGYGHAQVLKWALHGTAVAYLDFYPVSETEIRYKLTAIVFPGNSVLNSIMQMRVFKSVVSDKIDHIVSDIKKSSGEYFKGNKEPMLKSASLKSMENVQYVVDFENVVNGAPWKLGDFEKLRKQREQTKEVPVPLQVKE